jgi:hypothetical protein
MEDLSMAIIIISLLIYTFVSSNKEMIFKCDNQKIEGSK